jgi:predicted dehydrogenase
MKPVQAAIVGCGRISDLHAMGYQGLETAHIAAVCDTNLHRAREKARAWGVEKIYTQYKQVLADPDIDLVELLTPHHLHCAMTVAACQAGKHVSVQKPMALNTAQADQMITAAQQANVKLRVYENFVFYAPAVRARELIQAGEIGEPRMIRLHVSTGTSDTAWKVPLSAWLWRFNEKQSGGGELIFDHGYHLFSIAYDLMGPVERVYAWIDQTPVAPGVHIDAPATIMLQFKAPHRYGVFDVEHTPKMRIYSKYYADDDRVEIIGETGILMINRYTARTLDLPELLLFRDGKTSAIPVDKVEWEDSFIAATRHMVEAIQKDLPPRLDGAAGKAVLQIALAAQLSARTGKEMDPSRV